MAQSDLKIGSALTERVGHGDVGGCHPLGYSAWWLLQLAIEKAWSVQQCMAAVAVGYRKGLVSVTVHGGCCSWLEKRPQQCMVAVATGYRKGLVSTRWSVFSFLAQMSVEANAVQEKL